MLPVDAIWLGAGLAGGFGLTMAIAAAGGWPEALGVAFLACLGLVLLKEIGRQTAEARFGKIAVRRAIVVLGSSTLSASMAGLFQVLLHA